MSEQPHESVPEPTQQGSAANQLEPAAPMAGTGTQPLGMQSCPNCGAETHASATICHACGEHLGQRPTNIRCRQCGQRASSNLTICPHCGRELRPAPSRIWTWVVPAVIGLLVLVIWLSRMQSSPIGWMQSQVERGTTLLSSLSGEMAPELAPAQSLQMTPVIGQSATGDEGGNNDVVANEASDISSESVAAQAITESETISASVASQESEQEDVEADLRVALEPSETPSPEPTASSTPSATASSTDTATPSATPSPTPVPTETATAEPTPEPTQKSTATTTTAPQATSTEKAVATASVTVAAKDAKATTSVASVTPASGRSATPAPTVRATATEAATAGALRRTTTTATSTAEAVILAPTDTPDSPVQAAALALVPTNTPIPVQTYQVRAGDTLVGIALRYGVTTDALMAANNVAPGDAYTLRVGSTLIVPVEGGSEAPAAQTYTVRAGDTLLSIALRYGLSIEAIQLANGLSADEVRLIRPGQELIIPADDGLSSSESTAPTATATLESTATSVPAATPLPTPTVSPLRLDAPRLRSPETNSVVSCQGSTQLAWEGVNFVMPSDEYVMHLGFVSAVTESDSGTDEVITWVLHQARPSNRTSWEMDNDLCGLAPQEFGRTWRWYVDIVDEEGATVSRPSEVWGFSWN